MSHFTIISLGFPLGKPLAGETSVPGDKSICHRAVLFSGIAKGQSHLRGISQGEDNQRTVVALSALGAEIDQRPDGALLVTGKGLRGLQKPSADLDCGNSGTSMRLLCGLLAAQPFSSRLIGDRYLHQRPMMRVVKPLSAMGATIVGAPGTKPSEIYPPLCVNPQGTAPQLQSLTYESPIASAQVKSAILLCGLYVDGGCTTVLEPGRSRDHTERMLGALGVPLVCSEDADGRARATLDLRGHSGPLSIPSFSMTVPGDLSSAAFLLGAALASPGSDVVVRGVLVNPSRTGVLDVFEQMAPGALQVESESQVLGEPVADLRIRGPKDGLRAVRVSGALALRSLDELPLIAALCALAEGESQISDAAELRVKESDRIVASCQMLRSFGVDCEELADGLVVRGQGRSQLRSGVVQSHGDHRIAMAGAVLGLFAGSAGAKTQVQDVHNVATSFPTFVQTLATLGADIS